MAGFRDLLSLVLHWWNNRQTARAASSIFLALPRSDFPADDNVDFISLPRAAFTVASPGEHKAAPRHVFYFDGRLTFFGG